MVSFRYVITDKAGIHARPASILVQAAAKMDSSVKMLFNGMEGDCKKLISLMRLGVKHGSEVEFVVDGASEVDDAKALEAVVVANL